MSKENEVKHPPWVKAWLPCALVLAVPVCTALGWVAQRRFLRLPISPTPQPNGEVTPDFYHLIFEGNGKKSYLEAPVGVKERLVKYFPPTVYAWANYFQWAETTTSVDTVLTATLAAMTSCGNSSYEEDGKLGLLGVKPEILPDWATDETLFDPQMNLMFGLDRFKDILRQEGGDIGQALAVYMYGEDATQEQVDHVLRMGGIYVQATEGDEPTVLRYFLTEDEDFRARCEKASGG